MILLRDMTDVLSIMKRTSKGVQDSAKPCDIVYGTVISTSPLKVKVDQKLTLEAEQLKLTRAVMDHEVEMTVDHQTETATGGSGDSAFESHLHNYKGRKKFIIHNSLKQNDKVTMIRAHGGQQYLIIDKEVV